MLKKVLPNVYKQGVQAVLNSEAVDKTWIEYYLSPEIAETISSPESKAEKTEEEPVTISHAKIAEYFENNSGKLAAFCIECSFCEKALHANNEELVVNYPCGCIIGRNCLKKYNFFPYSPLVER